MTLDRKYVVWALGYATAGMGLGIFMAASHNHSQMVTHAHILLVGFVVSLIYGVIRKLWLGEGATGFARAQFVVHQAGAVTLSLGLALLYGGVLPPPALEPVLAAASIAVLLGALMMFFMLVKSSAPRAHST